MARPAEAIARAGLLLAGLAGAGLLLRSLGTGVLSGAPPTLSGAATLVGAGALLSAAGVPRAATAFAGGYAFGAWRGGALALAAQLLGCALDFWWARTLGRGRAALLLRGRLAHADRLLATRPFVATLTIRLLPVGNNLLTNLLAGLSGLPAAPFLLATLLGYLPQTVIFALAGSGVHVDRAAQLWLGAALFAASAALGLLLLRQGRGLPVAADAGTLVP